MSTFEVVDRAETLREEVSRMSERNRRVGVSLILLVVVSFAVRIAAWAYCGTGAIESEGAEYARLAENLRSGVGYVGIVVPCPQLNFNPLFSLLIAGTSFVTHNYEWAGRLVALIMGALLPLPVFGIACRLFNPRVGFIAAILTVLHPVLVNLSFTIFSEGPYATLFLSSVHLVIVALRRPSLRLWLLVGASFGLTWLLRGEASAAFMIAVLFVGLAAQADLMARCKGVLAAIAVFVLVALPEVIFIYKSTGKLRLEGKSTIFFYTGKRILAAERNPEVDYESSGGQHEIPSSAPNVVSWQRWEEKWAFYGIDSHLKGMGFPMRRQPEVVRETQIKLKDLFTLIERGVRQNTQVLFLRLSSDWLGAPFLPALALLGAFRRPWRQPQATSRLFVLVVGAAPLFATFFALWSEARYYFIFVPLLSIWAANGLFEIGLWTKSSSAAAGWQFLARPALSQVIIPGLIAVAMIMLPAKKVRRLESFEEGAPSTRIEKEVGMWIGRQQDHSVRIMDLSIPLAYHAGAQFAYFPYCTDDLALRYLDAVEVDYVVLRHGEQFTKYYEDWLTHGIPDHRAELLHLSIPGSDKFVVYRWHRAEYANAGHYSPTNDDHIRWK
ncbi:MAG TPA: glycosyltransferase family 39 protein [Terriglobales bacterium]|nr:glycosyltransferase family 39 protein [Terriglobales bacterium]